MSQAVVELSSLTKRYRTVVGVEGLDLTVRTGEVLGVLGSNGAGKTTTLRLLLDLIRPTRGSVRIFGRPPGEPRVRARIGYLPGDLVLDPRLTGRATLDYLDGLRPAGTQRSSRSRRAELCERLGLPDADLRRRVREYSRGMRQKLGLVAALQHDPELLVLDEPTTGLDPFVREIVLEILIEIGRSGRTVLHSSHVLSEVERTCSRVAILRAGRLVKLADTEEVRRSAVRRMSVRFGREVDRRELEMAGVEVVESFGASVVLRVTGPLGPLLAVLARNPIEHLAFPEPSLEEAFVGFYREAS